MTIQHARFGNFTLLLTALSIYGCASSPTPASAPAPSAVQQATTTSTLPTEALGRISVMGLTFSFTQLSLDNAQADYPSAPDPRAAVEMARQNVGPFVYLALLAGAHQVDPSAELRLDRLGKDGKSIDIAFFVVNGRLIDPVNPAPADADRVKRFRTRIAEMNGTVANISPRGIRITINR